MILNIGTVRSVYTYIRLLSHCSCRSSLIGAYMFCVSVCIFWTHRCMIKPHCLNFTIITAIFRMSDFFLFLRYTHCHSIRIFHGNQLHQRQLQVQIRILHWSQLMRLWYLSHRRPAKAQASLHIRAVSPEPSLFAHMKYGSRRRVRPSPAGWLHMCV